MILRISYLLPIVRVQMLYFSLFCAFFIFSHQAIAQEPTTTVSTSISEETQLFISQSDSIEKIQNLILDTFEKEKDTLLGLTYCATFLKRGKEQENDEIQYFSSYQIAFIEYNRSHHKQALKHAYASV